MWSVKVKKWKYFGTEGVGGEEWGRRQWRPSSPLVGASCACAAEPLRYGAKWEIGLGFEGDFIYSLALSYWASWASRWWRSGENSLLAIYSDPRRSPAEEILTPPPPRYYFGGPTRRPRGEKMSFVPTLFGSGARAENCHPQSRHPQSIATKTKLGCGDCSYRPNT
jgi:hypothetical protein